MDEVVWQDDDDDEEDLDEPSPARRRKVPSGGQLESVVSGIAQRHNDNAQLQSRIRRRVLEEQKKGARTGSELVVFANGIESKRIVAATLVRFKSLALTLSNPHPDFDFDITLTHTHPSISS